MSRSSVSFFAANAVGAMLGPLLYIKVSKRLHPNAIISGCFVIMAVSGIMVSTIGSLSPFAFALTIIPATMSTTGMRPPSANLMLEQQQKDTGSASSLINFFRHAHGQHRHAPHLHGHPAPCVIHRHHAGGHWYARLFCLAPGQKQSLYHSNPVDDGHWAACQGDIMLQFLIGSVFLCIVGGIMKSKSTILTHHRYFHLVFSLTLLFGA